MLTRLVSILGLLATLVGAPAVAQPLSIVSTSPAANARSVPRSSPISVTFSEPLDAATVTPARVRVFGRWSGPVPGTLSVAGATVTFTPSRTFQAGEHVMLQLAAGITSTSGVSIGVGRGLTFWAQAGAGTLDQTPRGTVTVRRPGEGNVVTYGGIGIDLDGDRFNDFVVSNEATNDVRVFRNDGTGRYGAFTVVPLVGGNVPSPLESGDFNGDGHLDVAVANVGGNRVSVILGDGAGGFPVRASYLAGQNVRGIVALDADGDGHDDLVTGHRGAGTVGLLTGFPDGTFSAPTLLPVTNVAPHSLAVADFDEDGRLDVVVGDFNGNAVVLMRADGAGSYAESDRQTASGAPWMVATGDIDGDGHADVIANGTFGNVANVFWGDGAGGISGVTPVPAGAFSVAIDVGDIDGDGDLDIVSSNYQSREWVLVETRPGRTFGAPRRYPVSATGAASCMTLHDRDDDGDLDMTGIDERDDRIYLFENAGTVSGEPVPAPAAVALALAGANPVGARADFRVTLPAGTGGRLAVLDALGREVAAAAASDGPLALDVTALPAGAYTARLTSAAGTATVRFAIGG